ncbi:MAG: aspartate kinase [Candidatus Acidiferrales bacterium]
MMIPFQNRKREGDTTGHGPLKAVAKSAELLGKHPLQPHLVESPAHRSSKKSLRVMKFGGTSVGDASCIARVMEIIRSAARESGIVVVVSAMSGVTNALLEAAALAGAGDVKRVAGIFEELRKAHNTAAGALINSPAARDRLTRKMQKLFKEGAYRCQEASLARKLAPPTQDAIASLGERLCALLLAAALCERDVPSEAIEATDLIVTDDNHGCADPCMEPTRDRCQEFLTPVMERGVIPVVTGFIGATPDGVLTTLGRGGSDYSATILGAALDAEEVIIWTDVDGLMTSDPRLVPGARTVPEISYREAAELAFFGAKVLHPKTLRAVTHSGIPLSIRNTFLPQHPGTRITLAGPRTGDGVKALAAVRDATLIAIGGPGIVGKPDVLARTFAATAGVRADILLVSQSSSQNDICLVVASADGEKTTEALRREFAQDLAQDQMEHIRIDSEVAIVTLVGQYERGVSGIVGRTFHALGREKINVMAIAQGSSDCNLSFVVPQKDVQAALLAAHTEFRLGARNEPLLQISNS